MNLGHGLGHLTYSTLVHQSDNWEQLWKSINTYLPQVKARVAPGQKFGVCLRTSAPSAVASNDWKWAGTIFSTSIGCFAQ